MSKTLHALIYTVLLLSLAALSACSPQATPTTVDPNTVLTEAAATVAVELTNDAASRPTATQTVTPAPTHTPQAQSTTPAGDVPTVPPAVTNTPAAATQPPAAGSGEDAASFVQDVTVPDGTGALPGATFDKIWRIKNTGKTTWNSAYSLVFIDGERMGAPDSVPIPQDTRPGETVDIAVKLTAPEKLGSYKAFFRLRNDQGQFFRLDGTGDIWVMISVGVAVTNTPVVTNTPGSSETTQPTEGAAPAP